MRSFKEDTSSTLLSSDEVMLAVGQRLPNVIEFSKIIKPVIDHPNYYNIPYEVVAISDECVNYARAKSDDVGKHK